MFEKLGKFEIIKVLGNGAMGEVYLGNDPAIGREVAIKTILPSNAGGPEAKERFAREAKAAGVLNHPNLVTIYEFGEDQGVMYIAMELVRGHDLEDLMRDQSLTRTELLEILAQVCDGLDFAHRQHIVHRDIKPSNVRVSRDGKKVHAKVMDFGVARVGNSDMTATGMVMGTVSYMAPEYIRTGRPDPRSDLFAIGVMLYEGFSGRKPFSGDTTPTILYKIVNEAPEPIDLSQLQGISPAIKSVLDRALDKDPDARFQTADDLSRALRAAKDPTWQGQALLAAPDATVQIAATRTGSAPATSQSATVQLAPTLPQGFQPPAAATPPPMPAAQKTPASKVPLVIAAAALLLVASGGIVLWKSKAPEPEAPSVGLNPQPSSVAQAQVQNPATPTAAPTAPVAATPGIQAPTRPDAPKGVAQRPLEPKVPEPTVAAPREEPRGNAEEESYRHLSAAEHMAQSRTAMSEGTALAESNPEQALKLLRKAMILNPENADAYAWSFVILYRQGRYAECRQLFRKARREGVVSGMGRNAAFNNVMRNERFNKNIPGGLGGDE
jgi:serine/threonine-protein kinase